MRHQESMCVQTRRGRGREDLFFCLKTAYRHQLNNNNNNKHFIHFLQKYWPEYMIRYIWRKKNNTDMGADDTYMTHGNTHGTYQILAPLKETMYTDNKTSYKKCGSVSLCSPSETLRQRAVC